MVMTDGLVKRSEFLESDVFLTGLGLPKTTCYNQRGLKLDDFHQKEGRKLTGKRMTRK